jgi:hypothetical protein
MDFVPMGAEIKSLPGYAPDRFQIHGQIHHLASPLHTKKESRPECGQLYTLEDICGDGMILLQLIVEVARGHLVQDSDQSLGLVNIATKRRAP